MVGTTWFLASRNGFDGRKVVLGQDIKKSKAGNFGKQKSPSGGGGHEGLSVRCHSSLVHWIQCSLLAVAQYVLEG